jgi:hypothetical protein
MLKLRPPHGWNAVAWELAIVVLGVLIALGAQQMADALQWRQKVAIVRQSIMRELGNDRARWEQTIRDARCMQRDIDRLEEWTGGGSKPEPQARFIRSAPLLWMHSANWELAKSSQTLDHFPLDEQIAFATAYDGIAHRQVDIEKATGEVGRVTSLIPSAADSQERQQLLVALRDLRGTMAALQSNDGYMTRHFEALRVEADRSDFAADMANAPKCEE